LLSQLIWFSFSVTISAASPCSALTMHVSSVMCSWSSELFSINPFFAAQLAN
jgi:hypothetical protein